MGMTGIFDDSRTRTNVLYCLLTQAVRSSMDQEKQMPLTASLVFLLVLLYYSPTSSLITSSTFSIFSAL